MLATSNTTSGALRGVSPTRSPLKRVLNSHGSITPVRMAYRTSPETSRIPSFFISLARWNSAVLTLILSRVAIPFVETPSTSRRRTSRWRGNSCSGAKSPEVRRRAYNSAASATTSAIDCFPVCCRNCCRRRTVCFGKWILDSSSESWCLRGRISPTSEDRINAFVANYDVRSPERD
jgi:hypothetical protein